MFNPVKTTSPFRMIYLKARGHRLLYKAETPLLSVGGIMIYATCYVLASS